MTFLKSLTVKHFFKQISSPAMMTLTRGFAAVATGALFSRVLSAIAGILLVRYFNDPALYGQYATLVTILSLISNLLGIGFDTWLLREGGRDPAQLSFNARRLIVLKFGTSSLLIGTLTLAWNQADLHWLIIIGMFGIIAESYISTGYVILHALSRNSLVAMLQSVSTLLTVGLILILMHWPPQVATLIVSQSSVSGIILLIISILLAEHWRGTWRPLRLGHLIRDAGFFILADVLANIYSQAQIAILAFLTDDLNVGIFRTAVNLITMSFLVPMAMFNVGLPLLSRRHQDRRQWYLLLSGMFVISFFYGFTVLICFIWFGGNILQLLYGNKYEMAIPLLVPLSIVPLFKSLSFVALMAMLALGAQRLRVILQSVVVLISLLGGWIIISHLGLEGATLLYIIVEGVLCLLYWVGAIYTLHKTRL
jgi:O-antigen/teichoic acid export membrane protein